MRVCLLCYSGWPQSWRRGSQTSRTSPQGHMLSRWSIGPRPRCEFNLCFAFLRPPPPSGGPSWSDNRQFNISKTDKKFVWFLRQWRLEGNKVSYTGSRWITYNQLRWNHNQAPGLKAAAVCFPVVKCVCAGEGLKLLRARFSSNNLLLRGRKVPLGCIFHCCLAFSRSRIANVLLFFAQMVKLPVAGRSDGPVHTDIGGKTGRMLRNDLLVKESVNVWRGFCLVLPACLVAPPVFVHCFRCLEVF